MTTQGKHWRLSEKTKKKLSQIKKLYYKTHISWWKGKKLPFQVWDKGIKRPEISGENHFRWSGGKKTHQGYILVYSPNHPFLPVNKKFIFEHRLVMEKHLKRYLKPFERIHHINGIKVDNRLENLMLFDNESEHQKYHNSKEVKANA